MEPYSQEPNSRWRIIGPLILDTQKLVAWVEEEPLKLQLKEIQLLVALTNRPGEVCTKQELLDRIWAEAFVEESNLARHIYGLREAFTEIGLPRDLIETVPRRGYRFNGDVRFGQQRELLISRSFRMTRVVEEEFEERSADQEPESEKAKALSGRRASLRWIAVAALFATVVVGGLAAKYSFTSKSEVGGIHSVVVLPLRVNSEFADGGSVALGVADSLVASLGKIKGLRVIAVRNAAAGERYAGDPSIAGRELKADGVIDGSLQFGSGRIRVTLRLVRSSDGLQVWGDTLSVPDNEILEMQDAVATRVAKALSGQLGARTDGYGTSSEAAYRAYLRGRYHLDRRTYPGYVKAKTEFEDAIRLDPFYSKAYAGLADVLSLLANRAQGAESDEFYGLAKKTALRAIEIDGSRPEGWTSLGWVRRTHEWDWKGSEEAFKKAIELDPEYVVARQWYALLLVSVGRLDEALEQIEIARALEPLSKSVLLNYIAVRHYRREFGMLPELAAHLESLEPDPPVNKNVVTQAFLKAGKYSDVVAAAEAAAAKDPTALDGSYILSNLAVAYYKLGDLRRSNESLAILEKRSRTNTEWAYRLALAYAEIGRKEEALTLLERCMRERDDRLMWLQVESSFDSLRENPRFKMILKKMGFPTFAG